MTKTFYEVYRPKSPDERKFVDKHVTIKHADRNGNGDDLFNAKNIKKVDRKKERHGYEPGEDAKVYENKEQLESALLEYFDEIGQEISYEELQELAEELQEEVLDELNEAKYALYNGPNWLHLSKGDKVRVLSSKGSGTTQVSKMGIKTDVRDEHLKHINENLISELSNNTLKSYIKKASQHANELDRYSKHYMFLYKKSKNPENKENNLMAAGSHAVKSIKRDNGIKKAIKKIKEETEQLDELSKGTLASYIKKAGGQTHNSVGALGMQRAHSATFGGMPDEDEYKRSRRVMDKRAQGIVKAVDRLTKENIDNIIDRYIKEEISLEEAFEEKISDLSENTQNLLYTLFDSLDEENQEILFSMIDADDGLNEALDFALSEMQTEAYNKRTGYSASRIYAHGMDYGGEHISIPTKKWVATKSDVDTVNHFGWDPDEKIIGPERDSKRRAKRDINRFRKGKSIKEQALNEISQKMARAYRDKAREDIDDAKDDRDYYKAHGDNTEHEDKIIRKRSAGIDLATRKIHKLKGAKVHVKEETKQLEELNREGVLSRYINRTIDNPKREKGRKLALLKKWGDKEYGLPEPKVKGVQREETENLEELNSYKVEGSHKNQGHRNSYSYFAKNVAHAKSLYHEKHSKNDWEIKSVSKLKD